MPSAPDLALAGATMPVCYRLLLALPRPACAVALASCERSRIPALSPTRLLRRWIGRWHRLVPAAAGQAAATVQPERLRDGSLLYRFAGDPQSLNGHAPNGHADVAVLDASSNAPVPEADVTSTTAHGAANGAGAADSQRRSKPGRRDREAPPQHHSRNGRETQAGRLGNGSARSARGGGGNGSNGSAAGRPPADRRNNAGRGPVPAQERGAGRDPGSVAHPAQTLPAVQHNGREAPVAELRPSFMDIPPPQQQYRSMTSVHMGGNDSSGEEDEAVSGPTGRLEWKSRGRPQRVSTTLRS